LLYHSRPVFLSFPEFGFHNHLKLSIFKKVKATAFFINHNWVWVKTHTNCIECVFFWIFSMNSPSAKCAILWWLGIYEHEKSFDLDWNRYHNCRATESVWESISKTNSSLRKLGCLVQSRRNELSRQQMPIHHKSAHFVEYEFIEVRNRDIWIRVTTNVNWIECLFLSMRADNSECANYWYCLFIMFCKM
jgi:hypothetical protein